MKEISTILLSDFYKQSHAEQYPKDTAFLASYATARMSRLPQKELIVFGVQAFIKRFLIDNFNETFFNRDFDEVLVEYKEIMGNTFPLKYVDIEKFRKLHELGYLPIEVAGLPEGTKVPIRSAFELPEGQCQVPFLRIVNTHPDFAWLTEFLESLTSSEVWYPMCVANQAYLYRQIVNKWYWITGCDDSTRKSAISEFGFRGGKGLEAAILASSAFLTSFNKTATIPAIKYIHDYYGDDYDNGNIASGMISTEHSVMCSNYAVDGDEETFLKKLFKEVYPTGAVSVVMDTYDYWENLKRCGVGELKDIIINRDGAVFFRGDSGDPVDIICGCKPKRYETLKDVMYSRSAVAVNEPFYVEDEHKYYKLIKVCGADKYVELDDTPVEVLGTVELLWSMFGGTVNEAGYKVLDRHVRTIYGDSITPTRAEQIYQRLAEKGFAACNVALGAGSFSMNCVESEDGRLYPFTRDSYGIAIKATWCSDVHGNERQIFKNPKTDTGKFKKSQRGLIYVTENENKEIVAYDQYRVQTLPEEGNLLQPIFRDGKMLKEETLENIRNRVHDGGF